MNIIFVCTGNTCRSPMAEAYLNSKALPGIFVTSRGLAAYGEKASENAVLVMAEAGIDISTHISVPLNASDIKAADKIICLSPSHMEFLKSYGADEDKLSVLGGGISDPFGGDISVYRKCRDEIFSNIDKLCSAGFFNNFNVVLLERRHIEQIEKLEQICFSEPWTAEGLLSSFKSGTHFFVAENKDGLMGYMGISAVVDEGYITNIAVFPEYRNKGVATALINTVFKFAEEKRLAFVSLEVRPSNNEAVSLYEKLGFLTEGRRKDFYRNPREDALIMTKRFKYTDENISN